MHGDLTIQGGGGGGGGYVCSNNSNSPNKPNSPNSPNRSYHHIGYGFSFEYNLSNPHNPNKALSTSRARDNTFYQSSQDYSPIPPQYPQHSQYTQYNRYLPHKVVNQSQSDFNSSSSSSSSSSVSGQSGHSSQLCSIPHALVSSSSSARSDHLNNTLDNHDHLLDTSPDSSDQRTKAPPVRPMFCARLEKYMMGVLYKEANLTLLTTAEAYADKLRRVIDDPSSAHSLGSHDEGEQSDDKPSQASPRSSLKSFKSLKWWKTLHLDHVQAWLPRSCRYQAPIPIPHAHSSGDGPKENELSLPPLSPGPYLSSAPDRKPHDHVSSNSSNPHPHSQPQLEKVAAPHTGVEAIGLNTRDPASPATAPLAGRGHGHFSIMENLENIKLWYVVSWLLGLIGFIVMAYYFTMGIYRVRKYLHLYTPIPDDDQLQLETKRNDLSEETVLDVHGKHNQIGTSYHSFNQ